MGRRRYSKLSLSSLPWGLGVRLLARLVPISNALYDASYARRIHRHHQEIVPVVVDTLSNGY